MEGSQEGYEVQAPLQGFRRSISGREMYTTYDISNTNIEDRLKAAVSQIFTELWFKILFHQQF